MNDTEPQTSSEPERGLEVFSRRSVADGGRVLTWGDLTTLVGHRLHRASAAERFVLDEHDERVLFDLADDRRGSFGKVPSSR